MGGPFGKRLDSGRSDRKSGNRRYFLAKASQPLNLGFTGGMTPNVAPPTEDTLIVTFYTFLKEIPAATLLFYSEGKSL